MLSKNNIECGSYIISENTDSSVDSFILLQSRQTPSQYTSDV